MLTAGDTAAKALGPEEPGLRDRLPSLGRGIQLILYVSWVRKSRNWPLGPQNTPAG